MGINNEKYAIKFKTIIIIITCITVFMMKYFDRNIISYAMGIIIIIKLAYDFSKTQDLTKYLNKLLILLGQYSLISYIMQILFLQGIYKFWVKQRFDLGYEVFIIFVIINVFLILVCLLLELLRSKFKFVDESYKLIFS
jgi:hypothetical protein